ncbi:MAG TPA: Ger(x)C family spore germination protein [Candidatus Acidoferrum sp.]|nr:Ger(x)C family spore germination protein [Candidatus Acidoferrum sp.]
MKKIIRSLLLFLAVLCLTALCGCWDMREINHLGLVTAVGVDKVVGSERFSVTVQIANPNEGGGGEGKGTTKAEEWIGTAEGDTLFEAIRNLSKISDKRIMWAHNNVVIIGKSLAQDGIIPVVDFFTHNPELRMKTAVVVADGEAKELISSTVGLENISGVSFVSLESYRGLAAASVESHMLKVSSDLQSPYSSPLIAEIRKVKAITNTEEGKNDEETVELSGAAVFRKDVMIGSLTAQECRGVSWILNQTDRTLVTVRDPQYENKNVSVETYEVKAKIKTKVVKGMPQVSIHITGKGDIAEEDASTNRSIDEVKKTMAQLVNKKVEDEVRLSLETIQKKYGVDVLGLAQVVHVQNDKEWESGLKDRWVDVFPNIPVTVTASFSVQSSTLNQIPMNIND